MHVAHFLKLFVLKALVASMVAQPVVQLQNGKARGVSMVSGGTYFLGLPFAAPPTKHLRWQPPQPLKPWTHIIDASNFRPACAQLHDWSGRTDNSEDCLYLDVYTPKDNFDMNWQREGPTSPYAVLLFIHGGGFTSGDSAGPASRDKNGTQVPGSVLFNGTYLSQKHDVVVVSINYRLGVFGFLGSKELEQRTLNTYGKSAGTGNYGIQDQRAAMKWVQDNIAAFGGDPNRVLIHGCSAGGVSISNHLVSPLSWPYFSSAVMESGNMLAFIDANSMEDAQKWYDGTMSAVGCKDVECLLNVTTDELLKKNQVEASPVVDGHNLLDYPRHLLRNGHVKHVPTIVGATRDELSGLESKILTPRYSRCNESCYHQFLRLNYGDQHLATMLRLYPVSSARVGPEGGPCPGDSSNSTRCTPYYYLIETITTDDALVCTARNVAQLLPAGRDTHMHLHLLMHTYLHLHMHTYLHLHACLNVYGCINAGMAYQYLFAFGTPLHGTIPHPSDNFASHCSQNAFDFDNAPRLAALGDAASRLGFTMGSFWANLAKSGHPDGGGLPRWRAYDNATDQSMRFGAGNASGDAARSAMAPNKKSQCDFLRWCRGDNGGRFSWGSAPVPCTPNTPEYHPTVDID